MWEQQEYDELDREQEARYRNPRDAARPSYSYLTPIDPPAAEPSAIATQAVPAVKAAKPRLKNEASRAGKQRSALLLPGLLNAFTMTTMRPEPWWNRAVQSGIAALLSTHAEDRRL